MVPEMHASYDVTVFSNKCEKHFVVVRIEPVVEAMLLEQTGSDVSDDDGLLEFMRQTQYSSC